MSSSTTRARGVPLAYAAATVLLALCWLLGEDLRSVRDAGPPHEERELVPSTRSGRFMSAGYSELAADLVWARSLVYYGDGMMNGFSMTDIEPMIELVNAL